MRLSARTVLRKSAQPFLPDFLTVCAYVVLGFFLTVLDLTNLPVLALLFTSFQWSQGKRCAAVS